MRGRPLTPLKAPYEEGPLRAPYGGRPLARKAPKQGPDEGYPRIGPKVLDFQVI